MEITVNKNIRNTAILLATLLILITLLRLNYPLLRASTYAYQSPAAPDDITVTEEQEKCDIFSGEWVPDPDAPYYTNTSCWAIHEHQNCIKYGRPDSDFMKWRWRPDACHLPLFDPVRFLDMLRNRSMAFVGDSVGRNQMQSMICLLSRVSSLSGISNLHPEHCASEYPIDDSPTTEEQYKRWKYVNYNFTLVYFRTPFLVRSEERDSDGPTHTGIFNLHLDESDESWTTQIDELDYIILNAGHWFTRSAVYYENRRIVGCHFCNLPNVTELPTAYAYRRAFRTALRSINGRKKFDGVTFLRTFAPSHFENGLWNEGGNCVRRRPFRSNETILEGLNLDFYMIQLEEFRRAEREERKKFRWLDTTQAMLLRPDGHPSRYGHWPNQNVTLYNDCVHWCLPGPIDSWADFLQHMVKLEARKTYNERRFQIQRQKKMQ